MKERTVVLEETIVKLTEAKKYASLRDFLATLNPADIAGAFGSVSDQALPLVFRLLPKELAAETFVEMETEQQQVLIRGFSDSELKAVVEELYVDDAVELVEEMPANVVSRILAQADPDTRKMINEILQYPEDTAGSVMTTEFVELQGSWSAQQAIDHIRKVGVDKETINTCYITGRTHKIKGVVSMRSLILADPETKCETLMSTSLVTVQTLEDQETVAQMFAKYNFQALPVVDSDDRLLGIVTMDDAIDIMEDETTEDMEKMAAMTPSDKPYLSTGVFTIFKNRIPWLLILMLAASVTGWIIQAFSDIWLVSTALIAYVPMLMDTGGNAGSQTNVSVVRSLAIQELDFSDLLAVMWKEIRVSLLCGGTLALVNFAKLMLLDQVGLWVALAVSLALVSTVLMAKLLGCLFPMMAEKLGLDPALASSPVVTTLADILSLLVYFVIAGLLI